MIYLAEVLHVDDNVEEEVVLRINGLDLTCFALLCPYKIEKGASYQVELTAEVFDEYQIRKIGEDSPPSIIQIDNSFAHIITGRLSGNRLDAGNIMFEDDVLLRDFSYLEGKMISWNIGRIDAEFL